MDGRKRILREANRARARYWATLPASVQGDSREVARRMMKERIQAGQSYGKRNDEWILHPVPTMNEPNKAVSWLTASDTIDDDRKADMFLDAGLARIDNVFMMTRRLFSALGGRSGRQAATTRSGTATRRTTRRCSGSTSRSFGP